MTREQAINSMISHGFTVEQAGEIIKAVALQEPTTKNDKVDCERTDCKNCVNHKYCDYEPTTKNDLGVKCIDRWDIEDKEAEAWMVKGRLQIRYVGTIHNIELPSVTPQEPKTGHWGWLRCDMYVCSECRNVYTDLSGIKDGMHYCPNCGADMREVEE